MTVVALTCARRKLVVSREEDVDGEALEGDRHALGALGTGGGDNRVDRRTQD